MCSPIPPIVAGGAIPLGAPGDDANTVGAP